MRKRALILNRRCIDHPQSGGAERYTLRLARVLIEVGYQVVWFSSAFGGAKASEVKDGILFLRRGNELTTHLYGLLHLLRNRHSYDLVIDEFNGTGFFTFWHKDSILLIHQLYQEFFNAEFGVLGYPLRAIEKLLLLPYRWKKAVAVSQSTRRDLIKLGFRDVFLLMNPPVNLEVLSSPPIKNRELTLVYLGRLKRTKNPEDALRAYLQVKAHVPSAGMVVMGDGPQRKYLEGKYSDKGIEFRGFVSEEEKAKVLKSAHFLLMPSVREGWGIVVMEANACGTPVVGYRVPGLVDSIKDGETGVLVENYTQMAQRVLELWERREEYDRLVNNCLKWAKEYSSYNFEARVKELLSYIGKLN